MKTIIEGVIQNVAEYAWISLDVSLSRVNYRQGSQYVRQ